ncbi:PLSCR2, partial [Symbiodinium pilosum]
DVDENDVRLWEAREALLVLLQGFRRRNLEPKPEILANLLHNAALLSVRDSHWFILCQRLMVPSSAHPKRAPHSMAPSPAEAFMEVLSEADLAKTTLALARLSLPQLVDGASLFSRAAALVRQPAAAVAVLEAAAIFALTERRPQDLTPAALSPLVQAVHEGRRRLSDVEQPEE